MSFPYALLHFEAEQAKLRLTQVFYTEPGLRSGSFYQPPKVGRVFLDGESDGCQDITGFGPSAFGLGRIL
jgi:hypothetical protein